MSSEILINIGPFVLQLLLENFFNVEERDNRQLIIQKDNENAVNVVCEQRENYKQNEPM